MFTGTVQETGVAPEKYRNRWVLEDGNVHVTPAIQVKYQVNNVWTGELGTDVTVYTPDPKLDLFGYEFEVDEEYLVFTGKRRLQDVASTSKDEKSQDCELKLPQVSGNFTRPQFIKKEQSGRSASPLQSAT